VAYDEFMQLRLLRRLRQWETKPSVSAEHLAWKSRSEEPAVWAPDAVGCPKGCFCQVPTKNRKVHQWLILIPFYFSTTCCKN